jgi:hypothetical protein
MSSTPPPIQLSAEELRAMIALLEPHLFRVKAMIASGYDTRTRPEHIAAAESAVAVLKAAMNGRSDE